MSPQKLLNFVSHNSILRNLWMLTMLLFTLYSEKFMQSYWLQCTLETSTVASLKVLCSILPSSICSILKERGKALQKLTNEVVKFTQLEYASMTAEIQQYLATQALVDGLPYPELVKTPLLTHHKVCRSDSNVCQQIEEKSYQQEKRKSMISYVVSKDEQ